MNAEKDHSPTVTDAPVSAPEAQPAPPIERLSDTLQGVIGAVIGSRRRPPRRLKSLLNGVWLGHPLHPAITDVPIAAWLLTALFDVIWLVSPVSGAWAASGAAILAIAGVIAALGAAVTGMADWSDSYGRERTVGLTHGMLNLAATILYAISAALRLTQPGRESVPAVIAGFVGLAVVLYAAYLGGEMVFTLGVAVNHTAWEAQTDDFEPVAPLVEVVENRLYRFTVGGVPVVLLRAGDTISAISATCPHAGGPLDEGQLVNGVVECPWHGSRFRMCDGRVLTGPATVNAARYDVRIRNGQIELKRAGEH